MDSISISTGHKKEFQKIVRSAGLLALWAAILVITVSFASSAMAQTQVSQPTNTTLWAGSLDFTQFGFTQFTLPSSGVILSGTATSAITGQPVRHLWYGDPLNGICRIDPEVDEVIPATAGIGGHFVNLLTCVQSAQPITPGQLTFDASTSTLYTADSGRSGAGILRFHYFSSGDGGQGSLDFVHVDSLIGTTATRNAFGGCPQVKDPKNGTLVPNFPDSVALGPDGNLYSGSTRDGAIIRIISPATFNPATDCPGNGGSGVTPGPNDKIQIPILSPDEATTSGHNFGLGWIGHTLLGGDNTAPWIKFNADQCLTAANGNTLCGNPLSGGAPLPTEILASLAGAPQGATITDAQYPTLPGTTAYFASFPSVTKVSNIVDASNLTVQTNYGGSFNFITGLTADPTNSQFLYVSTDPVQGGINGTGQIWQVSTQPCPPGVALSPVNVTATASASSQATVNWTEPLLNCQTVTSYVVRTLLAGGAASGVPDFTVTATPPAVPPPTATITGLTNGTSYQFEVEACDLAGCSPFSALSNVAALLPPATPTGVTASIASPTSANVAWSSPLDAQGGYTVSAFDSVAPTVVAATVGTPGDFCSRPGCGVHSTTIGGLISGHTYTFTVHASNVFGNSAESAPSLPLTLPVSTDVSVLMSAPGTVLPGATLTYVMTVTNNGPLNAFQVTLSDTLPAAFSAVTTTQGVCAPSGGVLSCNLGGLNAGSSATVTLSVTIASSATGIITNAATVAAFDSTGAAIADPNTTNNTGSATTIISNPCGTSTTDIQTTGSAQNGNPVHGTPDVFTWQIKNNQGAVAANCVTFSASVTAAPSGATLALNAVSTTIGTCSIASNVVNCSIGTIAGGQTAVVSVTAVASAAAPANSYAMTGNAQLGPGSTDTNIANNVFSVLIGAQ